MSPQKILQETEIVRKRSSTMSATASTANANLRSIIHDLEIAAPPAAVWKALTDVKELIQWLSLDARVKPGVGGSIWVSWGGNHMEESEIEVWEPNSHLRTRETSPFGAFIQPPDFVNMPPRYLDYTLTPGEGTTALHLEYSGFGTGPEWDLVFQQIDAPFEFHLSTLKFYLETHTGKERSVSWARTVFRSSQEEAWRRLAGPQGFLQEGSVDGLKKGDRYSIGAANGDRFSGVVLSNHPGQQFGGTAENLNNSVIRFATTGCSGITSASAWLGSYGPKHPDAHLFEHRWTNLLDTIMKDPPAGQ